MNPNVDLFSFSYLFFFYPCAFLQAATYTSLEGVLTEKLIMEIVNNSLKAHKEKKEWDETMEATKYMGARKQKSDDNSSSSSSADPQPASQS